MNDSLLKSMQQNWSMNQRIPFLYTTVYPVLRYVTHVLTNSANYMTSSRLIAFYFLKSETWLQYINTALFKKVITLRDLQKVFSPFENWLCELFNCWNVIIAV